MKIEIDTDEIVYESQGEEQIIEEDALAVLLTRNICWARGAHYVGNKGSNYEFADEGTIILMGCNDVFAWGCADAEALPFDELPNLYKMWLADNKWGSTRWVCLRRKEKPQAAIRKAMQKDGSWDEVLEALPDNHYDKAVAKMNAERAAAQIGKGSAT